MQRRFVFNELVNMKRLLIGMMLVTISFFAFAEGNGNQEDRRSAIKRVEEFESNMRASDPKHFVKLDMIKKAIPVVAALPPSQWEAQIRFLYSALTEIDEKGIGLNVYNSLMNGKPYMPYAATTSCYGLHGKCSNVCDAANKLESAANDLARCARIHDFNDDCRRRYKDVRDTHSTYENAISDADGDCN